MEFSGSLITVYFPSIRSERFPLTRGYYFSIVKMESKAVEDFIFGS